MPVLDSAIALITDGHLYYRGHDAISLAITHSVEEVAALLWLGRLDADTVTLFGAVEQKMPSRCFAMQRRLGELLTDLAPIERFQLVLPMAATEDVAAYDLQPPAVAHTGARILRLLTLVAVGRSKSERDLVRTLQEGWVPQNPMAASLLRAALILCADRRTQCLGLHGPLRGVGELDTLCRGDSRSRRTPGRQTRRLHRSSRSFLV